MLWYPLLVPAGVLLGSAAAKLIASLRGELSWPRGPVLLWWAIPAWVVITLEATAALTGALLPAPWLLGSLLAMAYGLLTVGAVTMRGRSCACFGVTGRKIGGGHIAANAGVAVISLTLGLLPQSASQPGVWTRLAIVALVGLAVAGGSFVAMLRRAATGASKDAACVRDADSILILTMQGCPACSALHMLLDGVSGQAIRWHMVSGQEDPYAVLADGQYPCAVPLDAGDTPTCSPRWGLSDIKRLVDTFLDRDLVRVAP